VIRGGDCGAASGDPIRKPVAEIHHF